MDETASAMTNTTIPPALLADEVARAYEDARDPEPVEEACAGATTDGASANNAPTTANVTPHVSYFDAAFARVEADPVWNAKVKEAFGPDGKPHGMRITELPDEATMDGTPHMEDIPLIAPSVAPTLRLRMKVWTDHATGKRYLMPSAFMRDVVQGQAVTDVMYAHAMSDESTKIVTLTAREWNALPFFYFREDGPAPHAASRPVGVVSGGRSP